jgi:predicted metal-dependent hydrolase
MASNFLSGWLRFPDPTPSRTEEAARELVLRSGESVPVRWVRDARARRLRLIVNDRGVRLTVPRSTSVKLAESFLFEHRDWLASQLQKRPVVETRPFGADFDTHLQLRDDKVPVTWSEGRYTRAELGEHGVTITRSTRAGDAQVRSALKDFYLQQARADLGQWLPKYLPTLPKAPVQVRLRPLSSLWGSLSPGDAMSLDLALVLGRPRAFEYVVVHELCHLIHRNHSRRFWREVEARCPDWREDRTYLHGDGLAIKAELRRTISR